MIEVLDLEAHRRLQSGEGIALLDQEILEALEPLDRLGLHDLNAFFGGGELLVERREGLLLSKGDRRLESFRQGGAGPRRLEPLGGRRVELFLEPGEKL